MSKWDERINKYEDVLDKALRENCYDQIRRHLAITDLFYLLVMELHRKDAVHDWLMERCSEVQEMPDGYLDLWARAHYKSTIISFAKTIQDILINPDITIGIFSHTRGIAKAFLRQIKREFEGNESIKKLFPDILFENPQKQSPKWSEDDGIIVKRKTNPKEATVEAWGLVDGQPTGRHFNLMVYDDVVTKESVTTPEMITKVNQAWELSRNLQSNGGRVRYIGTRYHFNDTYKLLIDRGAAKPRIYPASIDGKIEGQPVFLTREQLEEKRKEMGPFTFSCQMMQNPLADEIQGFKDEWIKHWNAVNLANLNLYLICDPANEKKRSSDYTVFIVIGVSGDGNYYICDMVRDRLSLTERANILFDLHRQYHPVAVGYEKYGMQADIEHYNDRMRRENYRFNIIELKGNTPKNDRIRKLIPLFEAGRIYLPNICIKRNYEGHQQDLINIFMNEEYRAFPVSIHDDMLDCLARIVDQDLNITPRSMPMAQNASYQRMLKEQKANKTGI